MTAAASGHPARIPVSACGTFVRGQMRPGAIGSVLACFEHSLYLKLAAGVLACVGEERIGCGPLNVCIQAGEWPRVSRCALGETVRATTHEIVIGSRTVLDLTESAPWRPGPIDRHERSPLTVDRFVNRTLACAPKDGLFRAVFDASSLSLDAPIARMAHPAIVALRAWMRRFGPGVGVPLPPAVVANLIGLGPGLTPSGDDLLAGVLMMLRAVSMNDHGAALWSFIGPKLDAGTNEISRAHLFAASQGEGHAAIHDVIEALLTGSNRLVPALEGIDQLGHTSGWDAAAGLLLVLAAVYDGQPREATASSAA